MSDRWKIYSSPFGLGIIKHIFTWEKRNKTRRESERKKEMPYFLLERKRTRDIYRERDGNTRTETDTQRKIARD